MEEMNNNVKSKGKHLILIIISAILLIGIIFLVYKKITKPKNVDLGSIPAVNVTHIRKGHIDREISVMGSILPNDTYYVPAKVGGDIKNIFTPWYTRYTYFREQNDVDGLYYGCIGTDTYVSTIMNKLSEIQEGINKDSITCWQYLSDCVANYYYDENYEPLYPDITDKSYRYNYEGSRFN